MPLYAVFRLKNSDMNPIVRTVCAAAAALSVFFAAIPTCGIGGNAKPSADSLIAVRNSRLRKMENRSVEIYDAVMPRAEIGNSLFRVDRHPVMDSLLTSDVEKRLLAEINDRCDLLGRDSLWSSDLFWVMKPYFEWLHHIDPHYRIVPAYGCRDRKSERKIKALKVPEFDLLRIGDTLIVNGSLNPDFRRGDRITAINGIGVSEYLKYNYRDRYTTPEIVMHYYYNSEVADRFDFLLERGGSTMTVSTEGGKAPQVEHELMRMRELTARTFPEAGCGYVSIPEFYPDNRWLIKTLRKHIIDFGKRGIADVILDLRMNPGGSGSRFDELISIFIDKPSVKYCRSQRVRCSRASMRLWPFLTESQIGETVEIPDAVKEFPLIPEMYVGGMRYYVMMSESTGSIASSFCNILQYNGAALLVGEPQLHNSLKYGECESGYGLLPSALRQNGISLVEIDEYTKAADGILMPDIPIPYVASEWLDGSDAMLDRLLGIIASERGKR